MSSMSSQTFALTLSTDNAVIEPHDGFMAAEKALSNNRSRTCKHVRKNGNILIMGLEVNYYKGTFQVFCFVPVDGGREGTWSPIRDKRLSRRVLTLFRDEFAIDATEVKWRHSL